ncbi:MAG: endonuclease NucS domain-containing protein [Roseiarcus sp.]
MATPVSEEQILAIRSLSADGLSSKEIAAKLGLGTMQVAGVKAAATRGAYEGSEDALPSEDTEVAGVVNAVDTAFGLERDMQAALRAKIEQLEEGLTIDDGGRERSVASGRIDITARDRHGDVVVIELKTGEAPRDAVAQILAYMGDVMEEEPKASVRGILIARSFEPRAKAAARAVQSIQLVQYGIQFTFERVGKSPI